ncbi:MAG TPA: restriction endonuclease subunit S, partial [Candidatus Choladousia intestinigallinarum]|nr:restriction endonuclease subunit S [Candidatus Choladousia intestinigallinarum]
FREVLEAGRMDAEYYQLEYTDIAEKLRQYSYESLNTACRICDDNFTPDPKTEYKYIELANIGNEGQINGCTRAYGKDLPGRARRIVHCGDIIVSSIEGSLQSCALVPEEYNGALCSTGFFVIHSEKINPETLLVLIKSWPIQALLKQSCSGTILTAFGKADLENIPLPVIREDIQKKIAQLIKESFRLREESGSMTNAAKKALETAIEQGEAEALKILEELG